MTFRAIAGNKTQDGLTEIQLRAIDGTVWLTQAEMVELFESSPPRRLPSLWKSVYREGKLTEEATCKEFLQVRIEGGRQVQRSLKAYRLDMILAIGYRLRSSARHPNSGEDRGRYYSIKATTAVSPSGYTPVLRIGPEHESARRVTGATERGKRLR